MSVLSPTSDLLGVRVNQLDLKSDNDLRDTYDLPKTYHESQGSIMHGHCLFRVDLLLAQAAGNLRLLYLVPGNGSRFVCMAKGNAKIGW